jgi:hypothetical protein
MPNTFDYYRNKTILRAIAHQTNRIRGEMDKEECRQEIFAELYDFMPLDEDEALAIVNRVGVRYRRRLGDDFRNAPAQLRDWTEWESLGDGNYMKKAHYGSAD